MRNGDELMTTFEVAEISYGPGVDFSTRVELAAWTGMEYPLEDFSSWRQIF